MINPVFLQEVSATEVELCPAGLACVQAVSRKIAGGKCTGRGIVATRFSFII